MKKIMYLKVGFIISKMNLISIENISTVIPGLVLRRSRRIIVGRGNLKYLTLFMELFPLHTPGHTFWHRPKKYGKNARKINRYRLAVQAAGFFELTNIVIFVVIKA
ncbi:hypothetical protein K9M48_01220 [Candidatus Gracilibacteria bacterium]|nr:hypothetical protein [Candidatus Gracilibacteria bacterium]